MTIITVFAQKRNTTGKCSAAPYILTNGILFKDSLVSIASKYTVSRLKASGISKQD
jgi:hypothetical protein